MRFGYEAVSNGFKVVKVPTSNSPLSAAGKRQHLDKLSVGGSQPIRPFGIWEQSANFAAGQIPDIHARPQVGSAEQS